MIDPSRLSWLVAVICSGCSPKDAGIWTYPDAGVYPDADDEVSDAQGNSYPKIQPRLQDAPMTDAVDTTPAVDTSPSPDTEQDVELETRPDTGPERLPDGPLIDVMSMDAPETSSDLSTVDASAPDASVPCPTGMCSSGSGEVSCCVDRKQKICRCLSGSWMCFASTTMSCT